MEAFGTLDLHDDLDADAAFFAEFAEDGVEAYFGAAGPLDTLLEGTGEALLETPAAQSLIHSCERKARVGARDGVVEAAKDNWPWLIVGAMVLGATQFAISSIGTALLLGRRF